MRYDTVYIIIVFTIALSLGAWLLRVSQEVQKTERALERHKTGISQTREATHDLEVEWITLNRPERLENLINDRETKEHE